MKTLTLKVSLTAIALMMAASTSFAASPNGPKPKCRNLGEIPVLVGGQWQCKQPSIKARESGMQSAVGAGNKVASKKPARARPDYIVTNVKRTQGNPKMLAVTVKNLGSEASVAGSEVFATVMGGDIGSAGIAMPHLKAGQSMTTFISFHKAPDRGSRIRVMADGNKRVTEKNENNNVKFFTYN